MRKRLTDRLLQSLRPQAAEYDVMDVVVPSMGARVLKNGKISFILRDRFPGSPHFTRRSLGSHGELTLAEARDKARAWLVLIERGIDPQEHADQQRRAAERERQNSFAAVAEDFIKDKLPGERKGREVERDIRREFVSVWGKRPITQITARDVRDVIRAKAQTAKPQARNLLGYIKRLFDWAVDQDCYGLGMSPAAALKPRKIVGEKTSGDRTLSEAELFALERAALRTPYPIGSVYRVLLRTALRLNEVADAHWSEFDLRGKVWIIPKERMKGKNSKARAHAVPLTVEMLAILNKLPRFGGGDYLFSTTLGASPVWMTSKSKARIDARMLRTLRAMARRRGDDPGKVALQPWTNHDIRRSVRSQLSRLRVSEEAREAVLSHVRPGIKATYDLYDYLAEKRETLEAWAARLGQIVDPDDQVLELAIDRAWNEHQAAATFGGVGSMSVDAEVVPATNIDSAVRAVGTGAASATGAAIFSAVGSATGTGAANAVGHSGRLLGRPRAIPKLSDQLAEEARLVVMQANLLDVRGGQRRAVGLVVDFLKSKGIYVNEEKQFKTLVRHVLKRNDREGAASDKAAPVETKP
jgi:integrase